VKQTTSAIGNLAENFAVQELKKIKYKIIARNYHCPHGEIDIIAIDQDTLVFVEVKARSSSIFGSPLEAVTTRKISKISQTGEYFINNHKDNLPSKKRIDVFAVYITNSNKYSFQLFTAVNQYVT